MCGPPLLRIGLVAPYWPRCYVLAPFLRIGPLCYVRESMNEETTLAWTNKQTLKNHIDTKTNSTIKLRVTYINVLYRNLQFSR